MAKSITDKPKKRGRPATGRDPMTGVRLPPEMRAALDNVSKLEGRARADLIREAIADWLAKRP